MSRQEKLIIIFLLTCAVIGLSISFYKKTHLSEITVVPSSITKEFAHLESKILSRQPININTSDEEELAFLPGIGPALAERIVAYRQENGPFLSSGEITNVSGIGRTKYERIKDFITTENE